MNETTRPDMHCRTTRATTLDTRSVFCALHSSSRRQRCIQSRVACLIQQRVNECDALHGFAQACSNSRSSAWVTEQQAKHPSLLDTSPTGWPRQMAHTMPCLMRWTCRSSWLPYGRTAAHGMHTAAPERSSTRMRLPQTGQPLGCLICTGCIPMSSARTPPLPWLYCQNSQRTPSN